MTNVANLPQIDGLADNDVLYVRDTSDGANPDKHILGSQLRPPGARITNYFRYESAITIPTIAAGSEATSTITVAGAISGDHVIFNMQDALPADLVITTVRVSANDTVSVRVRNLHASSGYAGGILACTALVIRSSA